MYYAGIDIGSTAIKIAIIDGDKNLIATKVSPSGSLFHKYAKKEFDALLLLHQIDRSTVEKVIATGYGRKLYKDADEQLNEITANAFGLQSLELEPYGIRTIINIGGQDSKVLEISENGTVQNFVMNDKCAAGTGKFLDMAARTLEIGVDELYDFHQRAGYHQAEINSTCAVFAESEIISLLADEVSKPEIVAGMHASIARRIARLARRLKIQMPILFDGGAALNQGLSLSLEEELMKTVMVSKTPEFTSAIGAAIYGRSLK
jgi:predicted CoA-substrate-specific enzyme activase